MTPFQKFWKPILIGGLLLLPGPFLRPASSADATLQEIQDFGSNPGELRMFVWIPTDLPPSAPWVVVLHGCTQTAAAFAQDTGWIKYANEWRFALLLPEQRPANNRQRCFNWFRPQDASRDQGEALSIRQMVAALQQQHHLDPERLYVTGLSAGGAMTAVMLATYPEVFAGGAIMAGIPYGCASGTLSGLWCMGWGRDLEPSQWGAHVRAATAGLPLTRRPARLSLWQGDDDGWVDAMNQQELLEQWSDAFGVDRKAAVEDLVHGYPHAVYRDEDGTPRIETYRITGMGHGQPIAPGKAPEQCGAATDYLLDVGICASYYSARFWGLQNPARTTP
ncbi:MAG: PHB depolymerase family esterase [Gammaproteobacteria bacterium]|nr:PHB depolymerase family esterase [Gammaproteobacteria bacterium]